MATPPGVPPLRVLEALGIGLSPTGEMTEAVTAEGAYYLERILLVAPTPGRACAEASCCGASVDPI